MLYSIVQYNTVQYSIVQYNRGAKGVEQWRLSSVVYSVSSCLFPSVRPECGSRRRGGNRSWFSAVCAEKRWSRLSSGKVGILFTVTLSSSYLLDVHNHNEQRETGRDVQEDREGWGKEGRRSKGRRSEQERAQKTGQGLEGCKYHENTVK